MDTLAILGVGGHGRVIADLALELGWNEVEFFDDAFPMNLQAVRWRIKGNSKDLIERIKEYKGVIVGIGDARSRWERFHDLKAINAPLVTLVHAKAWISRFSAIGIGSVAMAGSIVNTDAKIGEACIINTAATVDHDCVLGDAVHVCPGAHLSGKVEVGHGTWIGVGASIKQCVKIGKGVMIGAGAVVVSDIPDDVTVVGNPARIIKAGPYS